MKIDFHSHILPKMDDGASSTEEALKLLEMLKADGVDTVVATPHLYLHRHSVDYFLEKRAKCAEVLYEAVKDGGYPDIIIGAEVYFSTSLNELPLRELCIGETDYIMIELPYNTFSRTFLNSFADFVNGCEYNIILAHIERYFDYNNAEQMKEILSYGLLALVNCDSFTNLRNRHLLTRLIKNGEVQLLGTDLHSVEGRPPEFGKAERIIRRKISDTAFENMMTAAENVLNNESPDKILG